MAALTVCDLQHIFSKRECATRFFTSGFFHQPVPPGPSRHSRKQFTAYIFLKGQCHEIFYLRFFSSACSSWAQWTLPETIYNIYFFKVSYITHRYVVYRKLTTTVVLADFFFQLRRFKALAVVGIKATKISLYF